MSKKEKIITGNVTNLSTKSAFEFMPFFNDLVMMAIVKIGEITVQPDAKDLEPSQITVDVLALDSLGFVYEATLIFTTTSILRKKKLISDMKQDAIYLIKGRYGICQNNIIIYDPKYIPLPSKLKEKEVREAFKVNSNPLMRL